MKHIAKAPTAPYGGEAAPTAVTAAPVAPGEGSVGAVVSARVVTAEDGTRVAAPDHAGTGAGHGGVGAQTCCSRLEGAPVGRAGIAERGVGPGSASVPQPA